MAQCIEISIASFALATLWKFKNNFSLQLSAHMWFWLVITCVQICREELLTNLLMTKLNCKVLGINVCTFEGVAEKGQQKLSFNKNS
jgi:hypothetical protein